MSKPRGSDAMNAFARFMDEWRRKLRRVFGK